MALFTPGVFFFLILLGVGWLWTLRDEARERADEAAQDRRDDQLERMLFRDIPPSNR